MKILVADDSTVFRSVLQRMLTSWGFDVIVACDGDQAWDCLRGESALKLVVLDWMMPGVDGVELCRRIRSDLRGVYVIVLTAKTEPTDLLTALEAGADDYVSKPLKSAELRTRLRAACRILELQESENNSSLATQSLVYAEWG
jgi:DNA-binding response OmpR family regulator